MTENKDQFKGHDTSGFNESTDSDLNSDKFEIFDTHLSQLLAAKQELVSYMRSEKELLIKKCDNSLQTLRQDMKSNETTLRQTIDDLTADKIKAEQKSRQEMNELMVQLRQSTQELNESKQLVIDLQSVVKQKDLNLNKCENDLIKSENELKLKSNEFEKQLNDLNNCLLDMKTSRDLAQNQINSLKNRLSSSEEEIQTIRSSVLISNEKNKSLDTKCETILAENQRQKQTIDFELKAKHESMETIKSLTNSLNDNQKEIERLQKNWSDLEKSRINEIHGLKQDLNDKEQHFKQQINQMTHERSESDKRTVNDMNSLIKKIQETDEELNQLKANAEKDKQDFEDIIKEKDKRIVELEAEKSRLKSEMNEKIAELLKQCEELNHNLSEMTAKRDKGLSQLTQMKAQLISTENEKEVTKTSLINANEKCYSLEFTIDSLNNEIEKYKQYFDNNSKEKKEKTEMIETINTSLRERQSEIQRLNKSIKDLEKSRRESEDSRTSLMDDCNELRTTLMEVEKSRLEVRRELNEYKIGFNTIENKLKTKDNEIQDLKRRLETLREERNSLRNSLESSSKSLNQLKDINTSLSQRNKQLSAQMSLSESERREFERQLNSTSMVITDRESDVSLLKRDNELLKARVKSLETEKKRLERSYSLIEKEKSVLKSSLDDIQRKTSKTFDNNSKNDVILDEAKIITQGLAALELKNIELQRKVQGLQTLMNEAESINGTDGGHQPNGDLHDLQKLRSAQKRAEDLIERQDFSSKHLSNLEKELSRYSMSPSLTSTPPRFKEPPMRSQSVTRIGHQKHQSTDTSTPLPSYSSTSALNNVKRKLNYNKI